MKTFTAILAHAGLGALQALAPVVPGFLPQNPILHGLADPYIQLGFQAAATALQGVLAKRNSKTDPNGVPLIMNYQGGYSSGTPITSSSPVSVGK